eukprot:m.88085 g.88085  ORF g.88085 m.88085 type:complete len:80 (+) comp12853_c0_seq3:2180-2419(+)
MSKARSSSVSAGFFAFALFFFAMLLELNRASSSFVCRGMWCRNGDVTHSLSIPQLLKKDVYCGNGSLWRALCLGTSDKQ